MHTLPARIDQVGYCLRSSGKQQQQKECVRTLGHLPRKGGSAIRHGLLLMAELPMHLHIDQSRCRDGQINAD